MRLTAIAAAALLSVSSAQVTKVYGSPAETQPSKPSAVMQVVPAVHTRATIEQMVSRKAVEHGVPEKFAQAVIKTESDFNPKLRGAAGEYGLGQIFCSTARDVGFKGKCSELLDPETNLEYSMRYLSQGIKMANGDLCSASTFYNSGRVKATSSYCRLVFHNMKA